MRNWHKVALESPHGVSPKTSERDVFPSLQVEAQLALGHASAAITDAVYAERDQARVIDIMRRIG